MKETGAVKFHYESSGTELAPFPGFEELNAARQELRRLGLLGVNESGIGYGNVSLRDGTTNSFYITGSATGVLQSLGLQDCAKVVAWRGPATPSSDSGSPTTLCPAMTVSPRSAPRRWR